MTPKEKAKELYAKFLAFTDVDITDSDVEVFNTKQCVLIAVDELIKETSFEVPNVRQRYWHSVKREIEKL